MANMLYLGNTPLIDLSGYYTKGEVDAAISNVDVTEQLADYVEKVEGKGLSTNDFDNNYKSKLDGLETKYVAKVSGKGLSTNDFTNTYKNSLDNLPNNYVAKDGDKVVSSNDFTGALKTKLEGLENFDPKDINSAISAIEGTLGDITGDGKEVTAALDTWAEIKAFISDYENTDSVASLLSTLESNIHSWVEGKNYTTAAELGLEDYAKTADVAATYQVKGDYVPFYNENKNSIVLNKTKINGAYEGGLSLFPLTLASDYHTHEMIFYPNTNDIIAYTSLDATGKEGYDEGDKFIKESDIVDMATKTDVASTYETKEDAKNHIDGAGVTNVVAITAADFAKLQTKNATTLYIVK